MQKVQCGACRTVFSVEEGIDEEVGCPNCERRLRITSQVISDSHLAAQASNQQDLPLPQPDNTSAPLDSHPAGDRETNPTEQSPGDPADAIGRALANVSPLAGGQMQPSPKAWLVQDKKGREFGPITRDELEDLARARTLTCECRVRRQTSPVWLWAVEVFPELADEPLADELEAAYPDDAYTEVAEPPLEEDDLAADEPLAEEHPHRHHRRHRSKMLSHRGPSIMLLGLMGFLCGMFGIAAAVMGAQDIRTMRHGDMDPLGYDLTLWGAIIGVVGTLAQCGLVAWLWVNAGS